ncbi:MAG: hypothetical protein V4465_02260 [Patescibacteria group bacterium]
MTETSGKSPSPAIPPGDVTPRPCKQPGFGKKRGRGHVFTSEEAREAGKKGGDSISRDREYMSMIARRGGLARAAKRKGNNE